MNNFITLFLLHFIVFIIIINNDFMTCMNEVNDRYDFVDIQMSKLNALVLRFFHITMHSPFGFVHCSHEKIAGRVH